MQRSGHKVQGPCVLSQPGCVAWFTALPAIVSTSSAAWYPPSSPPLHAPSARDSEHPQHVLPRHTPPSQACRRQVENTMRVTQG